MHPFGKVLNHAASIKADLILIAKFTLIEQSHNTHCIRKRLIAYENVVHAITKKLNKLV